MRVTLLESSRRPSRNPAQGAASTLLHAILIVVLVHATSGEALTEGGPGRESPIVFIAPAPGPSAPEGRPREAPVAPPPEIGFKMVMPPSEIPTVIPRVDLAAPFDPGAYTGIGKEGGDPDAPGLSTGAAMLAGPGMFVETEVDEPVAVLLLPAPRYPPSLRAAGMEGTVVVEFVVDTTGRTEPASWRLVTGTHEAFEASAKEATMRARFRPARLRDRAVRQLVRLPIAFRLERR